jgi:hypothetical protein
LNTIIESKRDEKKLQVAIGRKRRIKIGGGNLGL